MRTALTLTQAQLDRMVRYARARMEAIDASRDGWIKDRERYENEYEGDLLFRKPNSLVFDNSNESLRLISSGIDYITARQIEAIFKVKPWFDAIPRTKAGGLPGQAEAVTRHLEWKLGAEQMNYQAHAEEVLKVAGVMGECVSKIAFKSDKDDFERYAAILIGSDEEPVLDDSGDFIFQEDGTQTVQANDADGNPINFEAPTALPEFDLSQPGFRWEERIVSDSNIYYQGAKAIPLHFKEFYCPLSAKSIQESDFVAHLTSMRLSAFCQQFGISKNTDGEFVADTGGELDAHLKAVLDRIKTNSATPKAAGDQPKPDTGENQERDPGDADPEFRYAEAYMTFDAKENGKPTKVFLTFAYDDDLPIFWDYLSNATPDGKYPFVAVVNDKEPGRWYGRSWYKKYESQATLIDKLLNQVIYRNHLAANPVKFRRKEAVVQWQDDQPFEMGPDQVLDLNDGFTANDAFQTVEVPQLDQMTKYLLEMAIANWRTQSGISTATQGTMGDMPAENTATGTQRIIASGNTIFEPLILAIKRCLEEELRMLVRCQYYYQENEEYTFQQNDQQAVAFLSKETVKHLDLYVELTLTNLFSTQKLQQAQLAATLANQFLNIPPQYKDALRPIYEQIFQALQIDNADEIFKKILEADAKMAQAGQNKTLTAKITENIAFKDLASFAEAQINLLAQLDPPLLTPEQAQAALNRLQANGQQTPTNETGAPGGSSDAAQAAQNDVTGTPTDIGSGTGEEGGLSHGEMLRPEAETGGERAA